MKTNDNGIALIKHYESLHDGDLRKIGAQPKMDPVGIWTVGYGHALFNEAKNDWYRGEKDRAIVNKMYPGMSEASATLLLKIDLPKYEAAVLHMIARRDLNDDQFSALVSFAFNCGTHYKNKLGINVPYKIWKNIDDRMDDITLYNYWSNSVVTSGGRQLQGLVYRRQSEAWLFTRGELKFFNVLSPAA
jgi:lysozyme